MEPHSPEHSIAGLVPSLDRDELELFVGAWRTQESAAGEALIAEGTTSDALFLVVDGELDVFTDAPGGECKLGKVGPGSLLGEVSLMDPGPATASVVTEQGCTALRLDRDRLEALISDHPRIATALLRELNRTLAQRIAAATDRLDQLADSPGEDVFAGAKERDLLATHAALYGEGAPA